MRKVILGCGMSLDGYIARRDGDIDFLRQPTGYSMSAFFATLDTVAFGRKTFDEAVKRGGGSYKSPAKIPTYVFSKSKPAGEREGVIFTGQTPAAFVDFIREEPEGKNILVNSPDPSCVMTWWMNYTSAYIQFYSATASLFSRAVSHSAISHWLTARPTSRKDFWN
jgi:hypothetical protein